MCNNHRRLIVSLLLIGATLAVYGQVAGHDFVSYDDNLHVYENPHVSSGLTWANIQWAFGIHGPSQWHPLAWLSHQLDCTLFGLNPGGHHLTNLALHLASVVLLFVVLEKMTFAFWPSALVAALFALHPLHVESVAWVSERRDVLSGLFFMLTLAAYLAYARRGGLRRYLLVAVCLALGLMSKPMLVTVPFVLLLLDIWPLGRLVDEPAKLVWLLAEKLPLLALSAISSALTIFCQQQAGAFGSLEGRPLSGRFANAALSYVAYLRKMIWPADLAALYPYPATFVAWQAAAALLLLVLLTIAVLVLFRRRPYLAVGWFWYLGMLVPVIGVVQVGAQAMADRFTYLPLIGVYLMIAWSAADLAGRWPARSPARIALGLAASAVLAALMACAFAQARYWRDSVSLFQRAVAVTYENPNMHYNLGRARHLADEHQLAVAGYSTAIEQRPDYAEALHDRGSVYRRLGQHDLALRDFNLAIKFKPGHPYPYHLRAALYQQLGQYELALHDYGQAIRLKSPVDESFKNRATILAELGRHDPAIADWTRVIEFRGDDAEVYYNRGNSYQATGKLAPAARDYTRAIELKPDLVEAYNNRGTIQGQLGYYDLAIDDFSRAIALKADYRDPYANRAMAYYARREYHLAWADVRRLRQLGGDVSGEFANDLAKASGASH